jgi:glyoxylase-like metal-dependent hydrolase (beta-lactamase superfamily II)
VAEGDRQGNGGIFKLITASRRTIFTFGTAQSGFSPTGPTWVYLVEGDDGWAMVDTGDVGSLRRLRPALQSVGLDIRRARRAFITHGHWDHDGGAAELQRELGMELWAHETYPYLQQIDLYEVQHSNRLVALGRKSMPKDTPKMEYKWDDHHKPYAAGRKAMRITHPVWEGRTSGPMTGWQTPGHTADELTVLCDGMVFTGDHVLPEISPHPSVKLTYPAELQKLLPERFRDASWQYGLHVYLKSLVRVARLHDTHTVLPAHRLLNKGKVNLVSADRAGQIIEHHLQRFNKIVAILGREERTLHEVTTQVFSYRRLDTGSYQQGLTEVVAHLELMEDCGDLSITPKGGVRWKGTEGYRELVEGLMAQAKE